MIDWISKHKQIKSLKTINFNENENNMWWNAINFQRNECAWCGEFEYLGNENCGRMFK